MKRFLTFFIIIFLTDGFGQNLEMDAELIELNFQYSSDPTDFFHFQNQLFFRGKYKGLDDYSIFKYDGIDAVIMKNGGGERLICGAPIIGDNLLYFIGKIYDDFYGDHYLWVSNGEENDAIPLIESGGNYELLLTIGSRLFFLYSDPFGKKLWTSNGTPETTIQLMDLHTAPQNAGYVKNVIESQGKLFFSTDDPTYGEELWVSDGTVNGTYMVKDIHEGVQSSGITSIISFNEKIYFVANDGVNGYELWTSDGTDSGTYILKNINPGNNHALNQFDNQFIEFDGNFYFFANDGANVQLWKSNGTTDGTTLFKNVNTFPNNYSNQTASINGAATDDLFVFKAYDYNSSNYQYTEKLMKSDGTIEGTLELLELNSNYSPFSNSQFDRIQNKIYFTTESTYPNKELWVTDGTSQGTNFVTDGYQEFSYFKSEGNNLFLKAKISHNEFQVLKVDYNSNSSSIFLENTINPERGFEIFNGEIYFGFDFNYFNNYHPSGSELWKSNLAGNNPILVEDINTAAPAYPTNFANFFNGSTVFNANNYLSYGLYSISTSNELTFLGESYMFQGDGYDSEFYRVGDYYYFNVDSSALNYDLTGLCRTDGTAEGTIKVGNVHVADHMKYNRNYFTHLNDDLYFIAIDGEAYSSKSKIWRTNATNNQTNILVDFTENSNNYTVFNSVIEFNNKIYFAGGIFEPPSHDIVLKGLWSYNPIGENTELIYEPEMTYWDDTGRIEIIGINEGILYFYNIQRTSGNTVTTHFYSLDSEDNIALLGSFNGRVLNSFYYNKFIISNGYFYLPFSDLNINKITLIELGLNHISLLTVEDSNSSTDINSIMSCGNNLYFLETSNYGLWSMSNENEFTLLNGEFDVEAISDLNCYNNELLLYAKTFYPENAVDHSELIVTNGNIEDTHEIIINVDSDFDQIKIEDIFIDNQNKIFLSLSDHYTGAELYVSELDIILTTEEINEGLTKDNSNVLIYPNPTSSEINVVSNDQSQIKQIQLYDLTGKLMEIGIYNSEEVKLNLNKYNSGIYLLKVQTEKNTTTKKVILK